MRHAQGQFFAGVAPDAAELNASVGFDWRLLPHDVEGSIAHARMLGRQGIIPTDDEQAGYLYAWLSSDYGQALITRYSYGSVILEFDRFMAGEVSVPLLPDSKRKAIAALVLNANHLRDEAWNLEQGALKALRDEIAEALIGQPQA